eukprot:2178975-Rhodomonas_salina.1
MNPTLTQRPMPARAPASRERTQAAAPRTRTPTPATSAPGAGRRATRQHLTADAQGPGRPTGTL